MKKRGNKVFMSLFLALISLSSWSCNNQGQQEIVPETLSLQGQITTIIPEASALKFQTGTASCPFSCQTMVTVGDRTVLARPGAYTLNCEEGFPVPQEFTLLDQEPIKLSVSDCPALATITVNCEASNSDILEGTLTTFSGTTEQTLCGSLNPQTAVALESLFEQGIQAAVLTCLSIPIIESFLELICLPRPPTPGIVTCGNGLLEVTEPPLPSEECEFSNVTVLPPVSFGCDAGEECVPPGNSGACTCVEESLSFCDFLPILTQAGIELGCITCGDGICSEADFEDPFNCPQDCISCGDGVFEPEFGEECDFSDPASPFCEGGFCRPPDSNMPCTCAFGPPDCIEDGVCDSSEEGGENSFTCYADCCGNGVCDFGDLEVCPQDCPVGADCGNGICESFEIDDEGHFIILGEGECNCPQDCLIQTVGCGNGVCNQGENFINCPSDCVMEFPAPPNCETNGQCDPLEGESCTLCPQDCGFYFPGAPCGNGKLDPTETCDDGNILNGDGCNTVCRDEVAGVSCGNDIVEVGEECDGSAATFCTDQGKVCTGSCLCI